MRGRIFSVKRMAVHDGDGIRTTLFLKGCPLRCRWCHNPEGISKRPGIAYYAQKCINCGACTHLCDANVTRDGRHIYDRSRCVACGRCETVCPGEAFTCYGRDVEVEEILPRLIEDRLFFEHSGGGVTLSGGEPLAQSAFTTELLKRLKEEGINTAVDTCGYVPGKALRAAMPYTDTFLYDVKAIDPKVHEKLTGRDNAVILENLAMLCESGADVEVRVPVIPGMNDGQMEDIADFLAPLHVRKVRLLAYHHFAESKYEALGMTYGMPEETISPDKEKMESLARMFRETGVCAIFE